MSLIPIFEQKQLLDQLKADVYKKANFAFHHLKSCLKMLIGHEEVDPKTGIFIDSPKQFGFETSDTKFYLVVHDEVAITHFNKDEHMESMTEVLTDPTFKSRFTGRVSFYFKGENTAYVTLFDLLVNVNGEVYINKEIGWIDRLETKRTFEEFNEMANSLLVSSVKSAFFRIQQWNYEQQFQTEDQIMEPNKQIGFRV